MRIDEIYLSVQGEGPRAGIPTVFVRTGGCNLRCPGWPCDTLHAVLPENRKNWERLEAVDVVERIKEAAGGREVNVCLTGGEPFLQKNDELRTLVDILRSREVDGLEVDTIECFSNGTILYPDWATEDIVFIMDWKLPGSGEDPNNLNRLRNLQNLTDEDAVKFVIKDRVDFDTAVDLYEKNIRFDSPVEVYYGVAWDQMTNATLVGWVLEEKLPWRLNVQMHNYIWDRRKRGI